MILRLQKKLKERVDSDHLRRLIAHPKTLTDFSSNDYLGLAKDSQIAQQCIARWQENLHQAHILGATGSRLLTGNSLYVEKLESTIASFHNGEASLLFSSGYLANVGLLSSIADRGDAFYFDRHIHASSKEGMRLSFAKRYSFHHNDVKHLSHKLKQTRAKEKFVCVESLYSTDGSIAPLAEVVEVCKEHKAHLIVDEAHAGGLFGEKGKGLVSQYNIEKECLARVYTYGKAFGLQGASLIVDSTLHTYLLNFCKPFIYTTGLCFPHLLCIEEAYLHICHADGKRKELFEHIQYFDHQAHKLGIAIPNSSSPIKAIVVPGNTRTKAVANALNKAGYAVSALLSPTVSKGQETLRITLHSYNTNEQIDALLSTLQRALCDIS